MPAATIIIVYVLFCLLVGLCGTQRRLGFLGTFILSILVTPVAMLILLMLTAPSQSVER